MSPVRDFPRGVTLAVTLVVACTTWLAMAGPASADANSGTVGWKYSEAGHGFYQEPRTGHPIGSDPVRIREWGPIGEYVCPVNRPGCKGFVSIGCGYFGLPPDGPPTYGYADWQFARADAADETKWELVDTDCAPTPEFVPLAEIAYQFQYEIERRLPKPDVDLRPQPRTLVNLPTVVSTDYPSDKTFAITVPPSAGRTIPLTGTINAHADFTWTFEDGGTASGKGRPYDGTDPSAHPGYYLTNTFHTVGQHTVTLTVTWTGTITVAGLAPETFDPVTFTADATVDVIDSHAVNTAP